MRKKAMLVILALLILGTCMNTSKVYGALAINVAFGNTPTVDGIISPGEYSDANSTTFTTKGGKCGVYFKHDGSTLYVAFSVPNVDSGSGVQILVDTAYDQAKLPQIDDYTFTISLRPPPNDYGENQGNGTGWTTWTSPDGWTGTHQVFASTWNAEFAIPYGKLGITAGTSMTIGISFVNAWTSRGDKYWPNKADRLKPSTWGAASSSDQWGYSATIAAYCQTESAYVSVGIAMDGNPTGFTTPHTFTGLAGSHTFTVPNADPSGHPFLVWNTGESGTTKTVTSKGTYTAYYYLGPAITFGPRLEELYGRFIVGPVAQKFALETGEADVWFDIEDPAIYQQLQDEGFTMTQTPEAFRYYHVDFNIRDQIGNGTHIPCSYGTFAERWRGGGTGADYYTYKGAAYMGYVPLDDQTFRHALAHLIPKEEIVAVVYDGIAAAAMDSLIPAAQKAWYKPDVDGHPYSVTEARNNLTAAGYVWEPTAPNPAPKHSPTDPDGNWLDPHLHAATNDPGTVWDDTLMMPMNHITFAGVTQAISPTSWAKDDLCHREWRALGLPIEHPEVDYGYLTDTMMDYYQYDMYALSWSIGRFPDHLYSFFHSDNNFVPEGYNIPGVNDPELDGYTLTIQTSTNRAAVKQAAWNAADRLAELCVSIPTITRPYFDAFAKAGAPGCTDTLEGIVASPSYGQANDWTFSNLHWQSIEVGGTARMIVGSEPTNYHPGYASTTDEWMIVGRIFDPLIQVDPYTHHDISNMATSWTVQPWTAPGGLAGMKTTFTLRDDIYWHDGVGYNATSAVWSLKFTQDQRIGRAKTLWENMVDAQVNSMYSFSVYHNVTSLWIFYDISFWAAKFPDYIYEGTDYTFRPEATVNPRNPELTCLIGTGPYVYRGGNLVLGGYVSLTAYRPGPSPVTTHWFSSVQLENAALKEMFHWIGDVRGIIPTDMNYNGIIDENDLSAMGKLFGTSEGDPEYDETCDIAPEATYHINDGKIDIRDTAELSKNFGKQRYYP